MPFWHGDAQGRPLELGRALGAFLREVGSATPEAGLERARAAGLDEWGAANLRPTWPSRSRPPATSPTTARCRRALPRRAGRLAAGGALAVRRPGQRAVVAGARRPAARAVRADVAAMHSDDGIVLRLPDTTGEPPEADLAVLDLDDVEREVTAEVGNSALFASRFRVRRPGLLLPRRDPRRRTRRGSSASGRRCRASEFASFPSPSRRPARSCRTSTTCPAWSS